MGVAYIAAWDMTKLGDGADFSLTLTSSGKTTFYIKHSGSGDAHTYYLSNYDANSSNLYSHLDLHGLVVLNITTIINPYDNKYPLLSTYADDAFADILEEALNAGATAESWGDTFTVTFSVATCKYTIACTSTFGIDGTSASRYLLGFQSTQAGSSSYTSTYRAYYTVISDLDHSSHVSDEYESAGVGSIAISDGGVHIGMARTYPIKNIDWTQQFESSEATFMRKIFTYGQLFNFEMLFGHCRTVYPFAVCTQDFSTSLYPVCLLREDGANFSPQRDHPDYDGHWHIPFKTYLYGWVLA